MRPPPDFPPCLPNLYFLSSLSIYVSASSPDFWILAATRCNHLPVCEIQSMLLNHRKYVQCKTKGLFLFRNTGAKQVRKYSMTQKTFFFTLWQAQMSYWFGQPLCVSPVGHLQHSYWNYVTLPLDCGPINGKNHAIHACITRTCHIIDAMMLHKGVWPEGKIINFFIILFLDF